MTQLRRNAKRRMARSGILGAGAVLLLTLAGYKLRLTTLFVSSLYLIAVTLLSLLGDFIVAAAISVFAFVCLDYFFVLPLYSFRVEDPGNALSLLSFLVTALVITRLVSRVRAEAREARLQRSRLEQLHHLFQQLLPLDPTAFAGTAFLTPFLGVFGVTSVSYFNTETAEMGSVGLSHHDLPKKTRDAFVMASDFDDEEAGIAVRRLFVVRRSSRHHWIFGRVAGEHAHHWPADGIDGHISGTDARISSSERSGRRWTSRDLLGRRSWTRWRTSSKLLFATILAAAGEPA